MQCQLACQQSGRNTSCLATGPDSPLTTVLSLPPGSPCDNFQGYCDVFQKCRQVNQTSLVIGKNVLLQVNAEGPLLRLTNLLFNENTLLSIAE